MNENDNQAERSPAYMGEPDAARENYYGLQGDNGGYGNLASGTDLGKHTIHLIDFPWRSIRVPFLSFPILYLLRSVFLQKWLASARASPAATTTCTAGASTLRSLMEAAMATSITTEATMVTQ